MGTHRRPNIVYVFADQWRASALGYAGDPNVKTPNIDALAAESFNFTHAVSCCPVCSPARASMITGQYPLSHGVFINDVCLPHDNPSIADCFNSAGYETGYIGKWHLDGHGRSAYIPPERRQGFRFWQVLECTHDYNESFYYDNNDPEVKKWDGYDAFDQTQHAIHYIEENKDDPFMLFLSWGPPHGLYADTAPKEFQAMYKPEDLVLPPNVPADTDDFTSPLRWDEFAKMDRVDRARQILAGYYAHCSALDACIGQLQDAVRQAGIEDDTIFIFTSDHGDMLGSHGLWKKQWPHDESARVPFLLKYPALSNGCEVKAPMNTPDLFPTLCGLCDIPVPSHVEGRSYASVLHGEPCSEEAALIANYHAFGQWEARRGGKEWRGVRTCRHTYVRDLDGPWLLFDNEADPHQLNNQIDQPEFAEAQAKMDNLLQEKLRQTNDEFKEGMEYVHQRNYPVDSNGTVQYEL